MANNLTAQCRAGIRVLAMAVLLEIGSGTAIGQLRWDAEFKEIESEVTAATARVEFHCTHVGKDTIHINEVWPSCGCMTPVFDRSAIEPGGKSLVRVDVDTSTQSGSQDFDLTVVTEPPSAGGTLQFRVKVPPIGRFEPASLDWPIDSEREPRTITFVIKDFPKVTFHDLTFDGHLIHAEVIDTKDGKVQIATYPLSTERPFQAAIYVSTGFGTVNKISRCSVTVGGPVAAVDSQGTQASPRVPRSWTRLQLIGVCTVLIGFIVIAVALSVQFFGRNQKDSGKVVP